ncbi:MAG: bifunctional nuclease family protein [Prevotellaceae bacterium]|jgi:bifunctional DNase/RNase|nr:bifunctional nuclease family protein [Prevotellaceae bacterium]
MNEEIRLKVIGLVYNQSMAGTYGLVLGEHPGNRRFSVMIGESEAQSIALKINNKTPARPLTHDLMKNIFTAFGSRLTKVVIYDMMNEVFYSEIQLEHGTDTIVIDARTSDAVALAVRCDAPMYIKSDILDIVGIEISQAGEITKPARPKLPENLEEIDPADLNFLKTEELNTLLARAVEEERYELAVMIRNTIQSQKSQDN